MTKSVTTRWILILLSKVKGKNKFSGSCYICGKVGHKSTECWSREEYRHGCCDRSERTRPGKSRDAEEFGAGVPAQSAEEGQEEDDEFQRPRRVQFHDEQKYPISKEEREEHELLGLVQCRSWCGHCAAARGRSAA